MIDLTNDNGTTITSQDPVKVKGLKTIYRTVNAIVDEIPTQTLYPNGTRDAVQVWNTSNTVSSANDIVGYLTDFEFPDTITQMRIDMAITGSFSTGMYFVGYSGSDASKRYTCPAVEINNAGKISLNFSSNGTSWSSPTTVSDVVVNDNEKTLLGFEIVKNENGNIVKNIYKNGVLAWTLETSDTAIVKPAKNALSLFFRITGSSNTWYVNNVLTDLTKLKITVNNEVVVNGAIS